MSNSSTSSNKRTHTPTFGLNALHLFPLCTVAVAVPLLSFLQANSAYFIANGTDPRHIYGLIFGLCIGLPAGLGILSGAVRFSIPAVYNLFHQGLVFALLAIYFLGIVRGFMGAAFGTAILAVTFSVILAIVLTRFYSKSRPVYLFFTMLAVISIGFPVYFVFSAEMRPVLMPEDARLLN